MNELKIAVEEPRTWARRMTITVPAERVDRERAQVRERLAKRLKLPGFRKGKVPGHVLEKRYGASIDQEALERLVGSAYQSALQQKGFEPITQGEVGSIDYQPGNDLTFQVNFEVKPVITLERLSGFSATRQVPEVTEAEVDKVLQRLREEQAVWQPVDDAAPTDGDMAAVEITPLTTEGEGEGRRYQVVLGEEQVLPEIEAALRELKAGDATERTVQVHAEDEGGVATEREQRIRIRLLETKRPELPALDDDFARSVGEFEALDDLKARVREDLEQEAQSEADRDVRRQLMDQVIEANPFDVPDSMAQRYLEGMLPTQEGADPTRVEAIRQQARPAAERAIRRMLIIEAIAEREALRGTEEEVAARVREIAERNNRPEAEVRAQLKKSGRLDHLEEEITESKVFEFLKAGSKVA